MKRFYLLYFVWLSVVLAAGYAAFEWYRHIESIGWGEVVERLKQETDGEPPE